MLRIPSLILIRNTVNGDPHCVGVVLTFLILCLWNVEQLLLRNKLKDLRVSAFQSIDSLMFEMLHRHIFKCLKFLQLVENTL
ncbi:hypothetical protein TorRG33x02_339670 [Trema orientale]|uniref:Uncharacterized protein n=1 Tax=Trema orientale TaxID=63057 RepID=A0A2P5AW70_TREOI|nr:hypothetical protein TorRG33x02_339670 [Trema orientale]